MFEFLKGKRIGDEELEAMGAGSADDEEVEAEIYGKEER